MNKKLSRKGKVEKPRKLVAKSTAAKSTNQATATVRVLELLKTFEQCDGELTLVKACSLNHLHKPTAFRLLSFLTSRGLLVKDDDSRTYRLSYGAFALGEAAKQHLGLSQAATPVMQRLCRSTRETVYLSAREGDYRVDIEKQEGLKDVKRVITLGIHRPLHEGAPSKVIAAHMNEAELVGILARTAPIDFSLTSYMKEIEEIRKMGYAEGSNLRKGGAISAPIQSQKGQLVAVLSVSAPIEVFREIRSEVLPKTLKAAKDISKSLNSP